MKYLLILICFLVLPSLGNANIDVSDLTVPKEEIKRYRVVEQSSSCTIIEIETKDGIFIYNVIAAIATQFIPEGVEMLCTNAGGSPKYCKAAYQISSTLVSLRGGKIAKGLTSGIKWVVKKVTGYSPKKSKAIVETLAYQAAGGMKKAFDAYREASCMQYEPASVGNDNNEFKVNWDKAVYYTPTESAPSSNVYSVTWQLGYTLYSGVLKLNSLGRGKFRVTYLDPSCQCYQLIEQSMSLQSMPGGIAIYGRDPVDVRTGFLATNYSADNFIATVNPYGGVNITVIDNARALASGRMQFIQNNYQRSALLNKFGMN